MSSDTNTSYQWRKDGTIIGGATASNYTIANAVSTDAGTYDCLVNSPLGLPTRTLNLVQNPGFEDGMTGWWGNDGGISVSVTNSHSHSGRSSVYIQGRTAIWQGVKQSMLGIMQPSNTYRVSAWVMVEGTTYQTVNLYLAQTDGSGTTYPRAVGTTVAPGVWTKLEGFVNLTASGNLTALNLSVDGPAAGVNFYADDFFVDLLVAPTGNLIQNSGFEQGTTGWSVFGPCSLTVSSGQAYSGQKCALSQNRTESWHGVGQSMLGVINPGTIYRISAWVSVDGSSSQWVSLNMLQADAGGIQFPFIGKVAVSPGEWKKAEGFLIMTTGAVTGLTLYVSGPDVGVNLLVDDVVVQPMWGVASSTTLIVASPQSPPQNTNVLFTEAFQGSPSPAWTVLHQDTNFYSANQCGLTLRACPGDSVGAGNNYLNLFLINNPATNDFIMTLRLNAFAPTSVNWSQFDLVAYDDDDNYARCGYGFISGSRRLELGVETNAHYVAASTLMDFGNQPFYLRMTKSGTIYQQFWSINGIDFYQSSIPFSFGDGSPSKLGFAALVDPSASSLASVDYILVERNDRTISYVDRILFTNFLDTSGLQLNGTATSVSTPDGWVLQLTTATNDQAGSAFLINPVSLASNASFSARFSFRLSKGGGFAGDDIDGIPGADGIVFVVQTVANNVGGLGGSIGYGGIANSLGVEYDSWYNTLSNPGEPQDPQMPSLIGDGNHIAFDFNGSLNSAISTNVPVPFNNGQPWYAWIDYNGLTHTLEARVSTLNVRPASPNLTCNVDLLSYLKTPVAYVGFTGATGGAWNQQDILDWQLNTSYQPIDIGIATQPQSRTNTVGETASFTVAATGTPPFYYQWRKEGVSIGGATNSTYSIASVANSDAGKYDVLVTNVGGSVPSDIAVLTILDLPSISGAVWQDLNANGIWERQLIKGSLPDIVFVVDNSSSTASPFQGSPVGDVNGDGVTNTILDAELAGLIALNQNLVSHGLSNLARIAVVSFASNAIAPDINPGAAGTQWFSAPAADTDANGTNDVEQTLRSIPVSLGTDYHNALVMARAVLASAAVTNRTRNLVFLSDGVPLGAPYASDVTALHNDGVSLRAFGAGINATLATLRVIDPSAQIFTNSDELVTLFGNPTNTFETGEPGMAGVTVYLDSNINAVRDAGEISVVSDAAGQFNFTNVAFGNYVVRQVIPSGFRQTQPTTNQGQVVSVSSNLNSAGVVFGNTAVTLADRPSITSQPANQSAVSGSNATFCVVASGLPPLSYQWRYGGANMPNQTNACLNLTNVQPANQGNYDVVVLNIAGSINSALASLTVLLRPSIVFQPQSQTNIAGTTASFSVTASSPAPLYYQWRFGGVNLPNQTNATLSLPNVQPANQGNYDVVVSNIAGSTNSGLASLTVLLRPSIVFQPQSQTNIAGTTANFSVTASSPAPLYYQWRFGGVNLPNQTNATLSLPNVQSVNQGNYDVVVSNIAGSTNSALASLTVLLRPSIVTQPQSQTNIAGTTANFSVTASSPTPLYYQWRFGGVNLPNQTNATLSLPNVQSVNQGNYDVVVSNIAGSTNSALVSLTVWVKPTIISITAQPNPVTEGSNVTFTVVATGLPAPTSQWQFNGLNLINGSNVQGATTTNLVLLNVQTNQSGNYTVVLSNSAGIVISDNVPLVVNSAIMAPKITVQPQDVTVVVGSNATFTVTASGTAPLQYQWFFNSTILPGRTTATLTLTNVQFQQIGGYSVQVMNAAGSTQTRTALLSVVTPSNTVAFVVGSATNEIGQEVVVPVQVYGFQRVSVFQFSMHWDSTVAVLVDVEQFNLPGLGAVNFATNALAPGTMIASWEDVGGRSQSVTNGSALFSLHFRLVGSGGSVSPVTINGSPTSIEVASEDYSLFSTMMIPGSMRVAGATVTGTVRYYDGVKGVPGVNVALIGPPNATGISVLGGAFEVAAPPNVAFTLTPAKTSDDPPINGVSTLDIGLIRRHLQHLGDLDSPYKLLAADVNGSGAISTLDIFQIRQMVMGVTTTLPSGMWLFVPTDYTFPDPLNPWNPPGSRRCANVTADVAGQDFTGIKLGDVNNSWTPSSRISLAAKSTAAPMGASGLAFVAASPTAQPGQTVAVPVLVSGFDHVTTLQTSLAWNPAILRLDSIGAFTLPDLTAGNFNTNGAASGTLVFSWNDPTALGLTLTNGATLFNLQFTVLGASGSESSVFFGDTPLSREASIAYLAVEPTWQGGVVSVVGSVARPLLGITVSGTTMTLNLAGTPDTHYVIEYADAIGGTNAWTAVTNAAIAQPGQPVSLSTATNQTQRFYRARWLP